MIKKRLQMLCLWDAVEHKRLYGGWIAIRHYDDGFSLVYWYQGYTPSEIMGELPGEVEIL